MHRGIQKHQRHQKQTRHLEHAERAAPADDAYSKECQDEAAYQSAHFLVELDGADHLLLRRPGKMHHFRQSGHDPGNVLDGSEGRAKAAGEHQRRNPSGLAKRGLKQFGKAGPLQSARSLLLLPRRGFGQKRANDDQRNGGNHAGHERVTPGFVSAVDRGQRFAIGHGQIVRGGDHHAADRRQSLRIPQHVFALISVGKRFRQPRHRGHKFHAHADKCRAAQEQQHGERRHVTRGQRRDGVEQYAPDEHAPAPQQIREISADQAKDAASDRRHVEQQAGPRIEFGRTGPEIPEL